MESQEATRPMELLKEHTDSFTRERVALTFTYNAIVRRIFGENAKLDPSRYFMDDIPLPVQAVWTLCSRTARPNAVVDADSECDTDIGEGSDTGEDNREVLVLLHKLKKWFVNPNDEAAEPDAALTDEANTDGESLRGYYRGPSYSKRVAIFSTVTREEAIHSVGHDVDDNSPSMLLRLFFITWFKALLERTNNFASAWRTVGVAVKCAKAARRVQQLAALSEEERVAYLSKGGRAGGSSVFSSPSMNQLEVAMSPSSVYTASPQAVNAEEVTLDRVASERCSSIVTQMYNAAARYYYAVVMSDDDEESPNYRSFLRPKEMPNVVMHFAKELAALDRYPLLPEDELLGYARSRRQQFSQFELLWVALAECDLGKVLRREVSLQDLANQAESEQHPQDADSTATTDATGEEEHQVERRGWLSPMDPSTPDARRSLVEASPLTCARNDSSHLFSRLADHPSDVEVSEALGEMTQESLTSPSGVTGTTSNLTARAMAAAQRTLEMDTPHSLLTTLRYSAVPEASAFAVAVGRALSKCRRDEGAGRTTGGKESASTLSERSQMLKSLVFPREVLPERSALSDVVQRITPFTPMREVAFILECLDVRGPCVNAGARRQYGRRLSELLATVPMSRERWSKRQYTERSLRDAALATGRPDDSIITFLCNSRVLRLEFSNPIMFPAGITVGYVCDCCGLTGLTQGYQACTYEDVRSDVSFYAECNGYDMCLPCAVFFFKTAYSHVSRALYPASLPSGWDGAPSAFLSGFYRPFSLGSGGAHMIVWSATIVQSEPSSPMEPETDEEAVEVRLIVSVSPYAAQPVAWGVTGEQQAAMVRAFARVVDEGAESSASSVDSAVLRESLDYLSVTPERRAALPLPPFSWRRRCRVVACMAAKNRATAMGGETQAKSVTSSSSGRMFTESDTCPVCLGLLASAEPTICTLCGHWFHVECLEKLPGCGLHGQHRTQTTTEDSEYSEYTDYFPAEAAPADGGSPTASADNSDDDYEDIEDDDDATGGEGSGVVCPVCRCKDFMPSLRMRDVLERNTYRLDLHVPLLSTSPSMKDRHGNEGDSRTCTIALASLISSDGQFHNCSNVASCQQLCFDVPSCLFRPRQPGEEPATPVLFAYEEERATRASGSRRSAPSNAR